MKEFKKNASQSREKIAGEIKEVVGKITGNEQLELKGKIQSARADLKKKSNVKQNVKKTVDGVKESLAGKINDLIDSREKSKRK